MGKFQKFCSERIHRVTDRRVVFEFPEIWPMEISEIMHCLPDNQKKHKILPCSPDLATAQIAPKIRQGQRQALYSRVLQISSKSVHFRQSYIRTCEHHQNALQSQSNIWLKPSFEPNNNKRREMCTCAQRPTQ